MKFLQYLFQLAVWQRLPKVPRGYSVDYDARSVDDEAALLMIASHVRSPHGVDKLKRRHRVTSAAELVARLRALVRRAAGTTAYDPMQSVVRQYTRRNRPRRG